MTHFLARLARVFWILGHVFVVCGCFICVVLGGLLVGCRGGVGEGGEYPAGDGWEYDVRNLQEDLLFGTAPGVGAWEPL